MNQLPTLRSALGPTLASQIGGGGAGAGTGILQTLSEPGRSVATGVYTDSLKTMWIFYVCVSALGIVAALGIGKKKLSTEHQVHKTGLEEEERNRIERKREKEAERESKRVSKMEGGSGEKVNGGDHNV